jgi:hypothetical protein
VASKICQTLQMYILLAKSIQRKLKYRFLSKLASYDVASYIWQALPLSPSPAASRLTHPYSAR